MPNINRTRQRIAIVVCVWFCCSSVILDARTVVRPGFNIFTPKQDVEIGQEAAQQAEKEIPILNDPETTQYVSAIGKRLAAKSMRPDFPWSFKVVNDGAINAFALPGGFIYINRGAIEAADSEAQIAGVIGHEIGHVVARHGTNQMSKMLLPQLGLSLLGGLTASKGGWGPMLAKYGVPLGVNLLFLKNSRQAEAQADLLGTQEMADAGYDPHHLAEFFEKLESGGGAKISGAASWFSDHPAPENRVQNIDREIDSLNLSDNLVSDTPQFDRVKAHMKSLPPPPAKPKVASEGSGTASPATGSSSAPATNPAPSGKYTPFSPQDNLYNIEYPEEWKVLSNDSSAVTFAPDGGVQQVDQRSDIAYGIQVSLFESGAQSSQEDSLETMTSQLISSLMQGNNYLHENPAAKQQMKVHNRKVLLTRLEGQSPYRNETEFVWVSTFLYADHQVLSVICISPESRFKEFEPAFKHVIESVRFGR